MLARVADALYWCARDIERAATVARTLEVGHSTALEGALQNGASSHNVWQPLLRLVGDPPSFSASHLRADERSVAWYLTLSEANPESVVACLERARTRVGAIRSRLPTEVFAAIGQGAMGTATWTANRLTKEGVYAFCHDVRNHIAVIDGTLERAVRRDEQWQFIRLGRTLERAIQITRLLRVHHDLNTEVSGVAGVGEWRTLLRLASSYETFVRVALSRRDPVTPTAFLLGDPYLPASVAHCLEQMLDSLTELRVAGVASAETLPKASIMVASRSAAQAAQSSAPSQGLDTLSKRLAAIDEAIASVLRPDGAFASGPVYAQAVRQAQN